MNILEHYLTHLTIRHQSKHLVCGDYNINILTNNEDSKPLTRLLQCFDPHLLNAKVLTKITNNSTSCIDLFANFKTETKIKELKVSDHSPLFIELEFLSCKNSINFKLKMRAWNKLNKKTCVARCNILAME